MNSDLNFVLFALGTLILFQFFIWFCKKAFKFGGGFFFLKMFLGSGYSFVHFSAAWGALKP